MKTTITMGELATRVRDIFSMAKICKWTDTELNARIMSQIWEPMRTRTAGGRPRFSLFLRGYAQGLVDAERDRIWKENLEFCYRDDSGVLFSTWRETDKRKTEEFYAAGRGCELGNMECAHVWRGTDKPFSPWNKLNQKTAAAN